MRRLLPFLFAPMLLMPGLLPAADSGYGIYADQDMLLPFFNEDRDYTMGIAVERFETHDEHLDWLDDAAGWLGARLGVHANDDTIRRSVLLGSVNYTPDDLSASEVLTDDRPYASVLFISTKRVEAANNVAVGFEGQFGLLGTYVARSVQTGLHRVWRDATGDSEPVDPKGWRNQISAGGEPTIRLRVAKSVRFAGDSRLWDLARTWDATLGYQTNASFGLSGRLGMLRSPFWTLPFDPINRGNFLPHTRTPDLELYAWMAYRARLVGYDALLQGQFRDSALTYDAGDLRRLVHEGGLGITGTWRAIQLTFAANVKTAELKVGQADRTHWWGGTYLTWRF